MLKNRHRLKKKEAKKIVEDIAAVFGCAVGEDVEIASYDNKRIIFINGHLSGFFIDDTPALTVEGCKRWNPQKNHVTVDDGAIKFILNGADVMVPGITDADTGIKKGDVVWVRDERGLPLAVGRALMDGEEMRSSGKGKAVENLHHIGDELWELCMQ
ncbi:MAG: RNA-binding protein [Thermoplasmata archaeon]|nr:MAG: RNA-binding protein [Thermoplasmata archaeon]HDN50761.1 DUF1947 domain-containing protein [Thermoplasmatales archaeon]